MTNTVQYHPRRKLDILDIAEAYIRGVRDGIVYPRVTEAEMERAADAYVKLVIAKTWDSK